MREKENLQCPNSMFKPQAMAFLPACPNDISGFEYPRD